MSTGREAFEKWARTCAGLGVGRSKANPSQYMGVDVQLAWESWQAALAREKAEPVTGFSRAEKIEAAARWVIQEAERAPTNRRALADAISRLRMRIKEQDDTHPTAPAEADERPLG